MSSELFARVIMLPDASVYIVFKKTFAYRCTLGRLLSFLSYPRDFRSKEPNIQNVYTEINPANLELTDIPGLTLLKAYADNTVVCVFPELFQLLSASYYRQTDVRYMHPVNLKDYVGKMEFSNEKSFLLDFFCEANKLADKKKIESLLYLDDETQNEIMREILNTSLFTAAKKSFHSANKSKNTEAAYFSTPPTHSSFQKSLSDNLLYLSVSQFAAQNNVTAQTIYTWLHEEKLPGVIKNPKNDRYLIPANTPCPEKYSTQNKKSSPNPLLGHQGKDTQKVKLLSDDAPYLKVQEKIKAEGLISDATRPFINTLAEYKYYTKNSYHEVYWNDRPALIIDINPEYFSKKLGKTNRELIKDGKAPVVPGDEECEYIIHHIGQRSNSPFAIISRKVHSENHSLFHQGSPEKDLHDAEFEKQKRRFWNTYLDFYDNYGSYKAIPATSLSRTLAYYRGTAPATARISISSKKKDKT